jgi:RNA polymerase sigma-70 factor (ECF subfamily)
MSDGRTDAEVIARILDGDTEQFGILVDRYGDEFARYATYMVGNRDDAADVIQDSLVRAFRSLRRCHDPARFKGWFFRIVSNQCKTHLKRRRRPMKPLDEVMELPAADDPAFDAEAREIDHRVRDALHSLPQDQREAFVLKYIEGLTIPEIAKAISASEAALKMRLMRARRALLAKLDGVAL